MTRKYDPELRSIPLTFMDCPDREKKFVIEPYCQFGTDGGWRTDDEGNETKAFLHPCSHFMICGQCPRGFP